MKPLKENYGVLPLHVRRWFGCREPADLPPRTLWIVPDFFLIPVYATMSTRFRVRGGMHVPENHKLRKRKRPPARMA